MSLRGVRQLKNLAIRYSDRDGSSRGIRGWMQKNLVQFAASNPELTITADNRRNKHPCITGTYANGNVKVIGIKNLDEEGVQEQINHLRNQLGRKVCPRTIHLLHKIATPLFRSFLLCRWQMVIK